MGLAHFSASHNGVLAFRSGEAGGGRLVWVDRKGEKAEAVGDPADIGDFDLSPDGRWLALTMAQGSSAADDIWVRDLVRGVTSRFTFNDDGDRSPVWSPQGDRIAYGTQKDGEWDLAVKAVGGTGEAEMLLEAEGRQQPSSWSPDGRHLLYYNVDPETSWDIYVLDLEGEPNPRPFVRGPFIEIRARFSPDGRWVAYQSNESGHSEIYVQAFPGPGGKWQISTAGGSEPHVEPRRPRAVLPLTRAPHDARGGADRRRPSRPASPRRCSPPACGRPPSTTATSSPATASASCS